MRTPFKPTLLLLSICVLLFSFKIADDPVTIFSIGDSTMCNMSTADNYPGRGWMQMMGEFVNSNVKINNMAASGRSSKSFRSEGIWNKTISKIKAGDYVFIQFGHNDEKPDTLRHTDAQTTFKQNITNYVNEVKAKGAHPILFTSIARRSFDKAGHLNDTHGAYVTVIRDLAKELDVPLVDLNKATSDLITSLGPDDSKKLFMYIEPGVTPKLPQGRKDDTHLRVEGAEKVAALAAKGLKDLNLPISKNFK